MCSQDGRTTIWHSRYEGRISTADLWCGLPACTAPRSRSVFRIPNSEFRILACRVRGAETQGDKGAEEIVVQPSWLHTTTVVSAGWKPAPPWALPSWRWSCAGWKPAPQSGPADCRSESAGEIVVQPSWLHTTTVVSAGWKPAPPWPLPSWRWSCAGWKPAPQSGPADCRSESAGEIVVQPSWLHISTVVSAGQRPAPPWPLPSWRRSCAGWKPAPQSGPADCRSESAGEIVVQPSWLHISTVVSAGQRPAPPWPLPSWRWSCAGWKPAPQSGPADCRSESAGEIVVQPSWLHSSTIEIGFPNSEFRIPNSANCQLPPANCSLRCLGLRLGDGVRIRPAAVDVVQRH